MSSRPKKLTKEEKLARKKQLAEEKRLKKLETEKQQLRDELQREKTYTQNSRRILDDHWENICGEITRQDLLESLKCHRTNIERALDVKDGTIEQLQRWREEAGIQHKRLFEGHLKVIEYLMRIQKYFTEVMKSNYEDTVKELLTEFNDDSEKKTKILKEKEDFYEKRQHALNLLLASKYKHDKIQHDNKKLEIQFEAIDTRNKHKNLINSQMEALQNQIRQIYEIFHRTSANPKRMKIYEKLQKGDIAAMNDLNRLKFEREKCEKEILKLNQELLDIETSEGQKLIALRHERKILERIYWDLRENKFKKSMKKDEKRLSNIAMVGDKALKRLKSVAKYGESLLKMSKICLKLENPQEKLFYITKNSYPTENLIIERFISKLSHVEYSRNLKKSEKIKLLDENSRLQKLLREYFVQEKISENLKMLNCPQNIEKIPKSKTTEIVSQEASVIPQVKTAIKQLKMKRKNY